MRARTALIVGGGIAGLTAAIALRRSGYSVTVLEQADRFEAMGAALSIWENAILALRDIQAADRIEAEAAQIKGFAALTSTGKPISGPHLTRQDIGAYLPTRSLLQSALLEQIPDESLRNNALVRDIAQDDETASVTLQDGETLSADLVILANGIWSPQATEILANTPSHAGYGGYLALVKDMGDTHDGIGREYWEDGQRIGIFDAGQGRRYWFYMCDEAAPHDNTKLSLDDIKHRMEGWAPEIGTVLSGTDDKALIPFSIHAKKAPRKLGKGRIVAIGDAAHAMEPNLGQGACLSIEDAVELADIAANCDIQDILPTFEKQRLRRIRDIVKRSASTRATVHKTWPLPPALLRVIMSRIPHSISQSIMNKVRRVT
ncbi:NAD(P)/FAD-dependent oxidoreductase [Sphingorhabdus sp. Alg239-R122]|uniref:FAD-dependent oxidoreductase n=1 Tax=Sphingorhabdus sp. Alg239-R122 TaxID=2305989 RepID=UPI0013DC669A|nr:NAD(P)/FAD-dependent oxidoreductase [Sphingorhabdus sp. Alg239-R122]